jgi:hypothetical protein
MTLNIVEMFFIFFTNFLAANTRRRPSVPADGRQRPRNGREFTRI